MRRQGRILGGLLGLLALLPIAVAGCGGASTGSAAAYPQHDITFIVPYAPGGGSDQSVRRLAPVMQKTLGVQLHIVYKTGGSGAVGFQDLYTSKPDGYTIGNVVIPNILLLSQQGRNVGFDAAKFSYVAFTETTPDALAVAKNSPFKDLKQFVSYARAHPGKVTVAGVGVAGRLSMAEIIKATGIRITYVPVSGGVGPIVTDLIGGHVQAAIFGSSHILEHADTLRALAVMADKPSSSLPGVPTFKAEGFQGAVRPTTWGVMAPPGTPASVVSVLNGAVEKAVRSSAVQQGLKKSGLDPIYETPAQAAAYFQQVSKETRAATKLLSLLK
jgi:tripartite-type tricarboxylate transporter receptor subunit TctC